MWALTDEALLAGMQSGDQEAAAGFVRRYQARVFGLALTILHDRAAAEEVAQETFLKAWKHADAYDPRRGHVATWLLTITRNTALDAVRMKRAEPWDPEALLATWERQVGGDSDEGFVAVDDIRRLRQAIADLPLEQQRALVYAAFYGRTAREISELESAPIGTIKTRIRLAMLKLHSALEVSDEF